MCTVLTIISCAVQDQKNKKVSLWKIEVFFLENLLLASCLQYQWSDRISGAGIGLVLLVFSKVTQEKLGNGDSFLIIAAGIFLGFWRTMLMVFVSLLLVIGYSIFQGKGKISGNHSVALVPCLIPVYIIELLSVWHGMN